MKVRECKEGLDYNISSIAGKFTYSDQIRPRLLIRWNREQLPRL